MALANPPVPFSALALLLLLLAISTSAFAPPRLIPGTARPGIDGPAAATPRGTALGAQILIDLVDEYQYLSSSFPLETQSATLGTFAGVGDVIAQSKTNRGAPAPETIGANKPEKRYDPTRSGRFVLKGLGSGLIWATWFPFADGWSNAITADALSSLAVTDAGIAHTVAKTITSLLLEQFVACPVVYSLWDIPFPALLAGVPLSRIPGMIRDKIPGLLWDNAKVWTFANILIYNLPVNWRVFAVSIVEIFWASIVSSVATKGTEGGGNMAEEDEQVRMNEEIMDEIMDIIADEQKEKLEVLSAKVLSGGTNLIETKPEKEND